MQGHRTFTGDANIRPGSMDSPPGDAGPQRTSSTAVPAKQPASTQSAFNMGSGAAPISPSKKRAHRDLKMRQTAASSPSMQAAKANPFAPYGVHSDSSNLSSKDPAQRSPGKAQPSPSRVKVTLKAPNGAQGMRIDSGSAPLHKATSFGLSFTAAAPNAAERLSSNHATTAQPSKNPVPAGTTSSSTGFPSTAVPANPLSNHHATSASTAFEPAASGASSSPMASSANPDSTNIGARPTLAPTAATSPAAVTPPSFCFSSSHRTNAGASSPQVPFQGFGAAGATQSANGTPSASFAGLQPGMQSQRTPGMSTTRKVLRVRSKAGTPLPPGTPMSAFSQGTPLTPMDISPQPEAASSPPAPTPPPKPQFTPAWTQPPAASGNFSFNSGMAQPSNERLAPRQSPRTRRQASKPAADLPKSRFMPQDATDTTAASAAAFTVSGQSQPGSSSLESNAPAFGPAGPGQPVSRDPEGNAPVFGSTAQIQSSSAGSAGTAASAGVGVSATSAGSAGKASSAGTAGTGGTAAPAGAAGISSAGQRSAQPTFPNSFVNSGSEAESSGLFTSAASMSAASAFPFAIPGRPMDSRIKDACAMGFMGINLDSASGSAQGTSSSQMPSSGTAPSTTASGGATAAWGSATAEPSTSTGPPPPPSSQFQASLSDALRANFASYISRNKNPSTSHQVPQGDPPPSPFSFNLGAEPTPKAKAGRAMFGSEHVATNLHDKLVLEEEELAAGAEPTARSGTSSASHVPPQEQHATSAGTSASAANTASMPSVADSRPAASAAAAAAESASTCLPAFGASFCSTAAAEAAAPPSFACGAKPAAGSAAASASQPSQAHTFSFGAAAGPSSFLPPNPAAPSGKPFVFGARASAAAPAPASGTFPPSTASQAAAQAPAAQPASINTAVPQPQGQAAAPSASAAAQSMPVQFSAGQASSSTGLRNGLHSPSGIAKHTGPGRHSRAVPGSPGARHSARASPGKHVNSDGRPAGLPNRWTTLVHPLADPTPGSQAWVSQATHSTHEQAESTCQQHQAPAPQAGARHSKPAQQSQQRPAGSVGQDKLEAAAEQHRQKGNVLFAKQDFIGAGQGYTKGLNVLHDGGIHDGHVFVKLLTNRAACHLSLARPLRALQDCTMAVQAAPTNVRAATRAATCHLKMGQLAEATQILDTVKATVIASGQALPPELISKQDDLEVTKRLVSQATASLQAASTMAAVAEAQKLLESLSWEGGYCPFSQPLAALNAHALLRLHRFDEAVKSAQRHATPSEDRPTGVHWPWWVQAQASFLKGDLQQMQGLLQEGLQKLEQHPDHQEHVPDQQQVAELSKTAQKLLQLKEAGNRAVQASQWQAAVTAYSEAINACADAPAVFAAVLHSNRAAAYQALHQYADAVADNLRARALDPSYGKAYSRLAAVLSSLHLGGAAVTALEQLTEIVRKQGQGGRDPFKTTSRLDEARRDLRSKQPVHHYRLLGLTQACTDAEIRKAYKKSSLRFHPDKAVAYCKFAPALGTCGAALADRLEIETRVRDEANWLFKCISEANLVLSDQQKRLELNLALDFEERRMFYRNDLYTPPGGSYSFQKPRPSANPRPSAYTRPSARPTGPHVYHQGLSDSDDEDYGFDSYRDSGSNFY